MSVTETEGGKIEYIDWYPDQILKLIDLSTDVMPQGSVAELQAGLLTFELPKVTERTITIGVAAA
jgi:HSP20 family molecular chaperone IbpA